MKKPLKIFNASAGSGKTYTLVQEYLRIVLHSDNPMKFRSILAMTFTNKAANEMKERVLDGLIQLAKPTHDKTEKELGFLVDTSKNLGISPKLVEARSAKILNRILHNYSSFSVMTIDKFTHKVIRTFAKDLNISVDFDVELDMQKLRKNVTDMLFDQIGRDEELTRLMLRYANSNLSEDKKWDFSQQLYDFSNEIFKEEAIKAIDLLKKISPGDFLKIQDDLKKENKIIADKLIRNAQEAVDLIRSRGLDQDDFQGKSTSIVAYFKGKLKGDYAKQPSKRVSDFVADDRWGHDKSPNKHVADEIGPLLKQYFDQIQNILDGEFKTYLINKEILKNLNNLSLLNHLIKLVEQVKSEENILLISDFYRKIAEIITEEPVPFIYERLGVRYAHFLLDEFQDTSHLQWINMIPLVHNSLASGNSNLIVGDGKQAIYRWRNGEVEQFTGLPDKILNPDNIASLNEAEPLFKALGEKYPLTKNFRSAPEIVQFNNDLFPQLIGDLPENLQLIYDDIIQEPTKDFQGYVESKISKDLTAQDQLDYVLDTINRALANNYSLKDICILVRNNNKGADISRHLTENGIKVISPDSLFIGKDISVKFVVNLMAAMINPTAKNYKIKTLEHFSTLILKEGARTTIEKHADDILNADIVDIFKPYGYRLIQPARFHNLFEFVESIIGIFHLNIAANPFLQFLLEQVHLFEKRNNSNVRDFIEWFNDKGKKTSITSPDGAEAAQVMTIHKSKGLQFPIVICPFFDWKMDINREISWVESPDNSLPSYFVKMSKVLLETELAETYTIEYGKFLLDHLNLLYVAFTRPEVALFISGAVKTSSPIKLWLDTYFSESTLATRTDDLFQFGEFVPNRKTTLTTINNYPVRFHGKKMDKPILSFKSAENWDIDELDEKRLFGTKVHYVLSEIQHLNELEKALQKSTRKGRVTAEERDEIRTIITELFNDRHFAAYFESKEQLNEKEFINSKGRKLIPDKIIVTADQTLVVDFKTGQETPKHKEQVQEYLAILKEVGFENLVGEIYYTEEGRAVPVVH
ncbi:MAG: AAA family ATPase [Crocinitomix sp.]|nr:AAA family ATPase [Crocinitomix sp.]